MEHQCIREALTYKYPEPFDVILDFLEDYGVNLKKIKNFGHGMSLPDQEITGYSFINFISKASICV